MASINPTFTPESKQMLAESILDKPASSDGMETALLLAADLPGFPKPKPAKEPATMPGLAADLEVKPKPAKDPASMPAVVAALEAGPEPYKPDTYSAEPRK